MFIRTHARIGNAILLAAVLGAFVCGILGASSIAAGDDRLVFDPDRFTLKSDTVDGRRVEYRAYEGIVYVRHPVEAAYQCMNIFVPAAYFEGKAIGGYHAKTAPIFFPNSVGGYMPGRPGSPGSAPGRGPNAALMALSKGYVVAAPGARGRTNQDASEKYVGKAPASIRRFPRASLNLTR